jgi:hypothetical protein
MHWVRVPFSFVVDLYKAGVLNVQRHHTRRLKNAKHLRTDDNPLHMNFLARRAPDGKLRLLDGYTRIAAVLTGVKTAPSQVWLGVVDTDSSREDEPLYDAIDSRQAVKRGRDAFDEGLRRAGLLEKVTAPAFVRGNAVSAIVAAAGHNDVRRATWEMRHGIKVLDPLKVAVGKGHLPAGALGALLLIAAQEPDSLAVQSFAAALHHPTEVPQQFHKAQAGALRAAHQLEKRREMGALSGKNVPEILDMVLAHWVWQRDGGTGSVPKMTRAEYLRQVQTKERSTSTASSSSSSSSASAMTA